MVRKSDISDIRKSESQISGSLSAGVPEVCQSDASNTDRNKNEESNTDSFFIRKSESVYSCGSFQNVILADRELKELKHRFPYDWQNWIERLSSYMASTGKKYRNHYATICSWAVKEQKNIPGKNYDHAGRKGVLMVEHIIEQTAQKVKENQNLQNTDYLDAEGLCWCGI